MGSNWQKYKNAEYPLYRYRVRRILLCEIWWGGGHKRYIIGYFGNIVLLRHPPEHKFIDLLCVYVFCPCYIEWVGATKLNHIPVPILYRSDSSFFVTWRATLWRFCRISSTWSRGVYFKCFVGMDREDYFVGIISAYFES